MTFTPSIAIFWIALVLCVLAHTGIAFSVWRAGRGCGSRSAPAPADSFLADRTLPREPARGARPLELVWALVPAVALALVLLHTYRAVERSGSADAPQNSPVSYHATSGGQS